MANGSASKRTIRALLSKPFGPYKDADILAPTFKSVPRRPIELHNVLLSSNNVVVGLDTCEMYQREYNPEHSNVTIQGVLLLNNISDLSEEGRAMLQSDIRKRDGPRSKLTLESIYGGRTSQRNGKSGFVIKICIEATKKLTAGFLTSNHAIPNGLNIHTVDQHRYYEVVTMDRATYAKSQRYFSRYRTLRALRDVVAYHTKQVDEPTPLKERTPQWFADWYLLYMAEIEEGSDPAVHLSSDSSEDEEDGHPVRPNLRRPLRNREVDDVLGLIRRHAQWLMDDHALRLHNTYKLFDVQVWKRWMETGMTSRTKRHRHCPTTPSDMDADEDELEDFMSDIDERGQLPAPSRPNKRKASASPKSSDDDNYVPNARAAPVARAPPRSRIKGANRQINQDDDYVDRRSYDSDFSPSSSEGWLTEHSLPSRPLSPVSPTLGARVPPGLLHKPDPLDNSGIWYCRVTGCRRTINIRYITGEDRTVLTEDELRKLDARRGWKLDDDWVVSCYERLVKAHYLEHLKQEGISMTEDRWGRKIFQWKERRDDSVGPPREVSPLRIVKEEDQDG
ncbi:hypothetical protein K474DRAFT_1774959 [Panus rudis PR-1116 ss-1]|nr:hypothetical protein K474DRAFT_1774959 [Panus rudis PR-1116 ss-1]